MRDLFFNHLIRMEPLRFIDELAETSRGGRAAAFLDRAAFIFAVFMVLSAPHSIAATQAAWLFGMSAWAVRLFIFPRPGIRSTLVGAALLAFFAWSIVSALLSYEPVVSLDKLRTVSVLLIFFYVLNVVKSARAAHLLAFALISSCMISVAWTPVQRLIGRGVEVHGLTAAGPLAMKGLKEGDTIFRVDERRISGPDEIVRALETKPAVKISVFRLDALFHVDLSRNDIGPDGSPELKLGFTSWNRSSNFRSSGFYGHYTTFAEVLQLIGSLALGLFIAAYMSGAGRGPIAALGIAVAGIVFALILTTTRASQLALLASGGMMALFGSSRKVMLAIFAAVIPLVVIGIVVLQQQRQVGFFDRRDGSVQYREMMWRDGVRLFTESPRHMIVGVGMDSIKTHWAEWKMYDNGYQPMGHFHSTPIQLMVERGFPALLIWISVMGFFSSYLLRALRRSGDDWRTRGILLGCLGGAVVGFFVSGLLHWNLGDTEVAMVLYILMGISMRLAINEPESILAEDSPLLADEHSVNA